MSSELIQKVDSLEEKVRAYERRENLEEQVQKAIGEIDEYNRELRKLIERVEDLAHFTAVLRDIFDQSPPEPVGEVRRDMDTITGRRQQDILDMLKEEELGDKRRDVRNLQDEVKEATESVKNDLQDIQSEWQQRVSTARSVLKIAGGSRSFESTLDDIEEFVSRDIWKTSKRVRTLDSQWQGLEKAWEKEAVDWDSFQQDNNLTDETVDVLQELSKGENVRVGDLKSEVLDDMSRVDQLGNNIKLSI